MNGESGKIGRSFIILLALLTFWVVFMKPAIHAARERTRRSSCMSNLGAIDKMCVLYSMDNTNAFPPNITALCCLTGTCYITELKVFRCWASHTQVGSMTNVDEWMDYIYIPWATGANTPPDYPLMYDRRLSNHQGKGINVVYLDGHVEFDEGAKRLKAFAAKHPKLHIPMPEDLK